MADRGEGSQTRAQRLSRVKRGPGVFVYNGEGMDHESKPTIMKRGREEPVFGADGSMVLDVAGRQVKQAIGEPVRNERGELMMGGAPIVERKPVPVFRFVNHQFKAGEPVAVRDESLALKLRSMGCFEEVDPSAIEKPKAKAKKSIDAAGPITQAGEQAEW